MITSRQLAMAVIAKAKENPDRIYTVENQATTAADCYYDCYYAYDALMETDEGCIVGQGLMDLGVPRDVLKRVDNTPGGTGFAYIVNDTNETANGLLMPYVDFSPGEEDPWFKFVINTQSFQDVGETWMNSVLYAADNLPEDLQAEVTEALKERDGAEHRG